MAMHDVLILIPAAGASTRMRGRDKLLEPVAGQPLLARQIGVALATGAKVAVTLPPDNPDRRAVTEALAQDRLQMLVVQKADEGMAASLRAGAEAAAAISADALMVLLPDMPEIETADMQAVLDRFDGNGVVRATDADGRAGHPVILPARLFPAVGALHGDQGARSVLQGEEITTLALPGHRATTDLDTPEDWAAWRQHHGDQATKD